MFKVNRNPTKRDLRFFAWSMLLGFDGLSSLLLVTAWLKFGRERPFFSPGSGVMLAAIALAAIGTVTGVLSLLSRRVARKLSIAWMTVTVPIGIVMSAILLTVLFVFLLPLFSVIVRLGDPLRKKLGGTTYWEDYKPYEHTLERMRRLF